MTKRRNSNSDDNSSRQSSKKRQRPEMQVLPMPSKETSQPKTNECFLQAGAIQVINSPLTQVPTNAQQHVVVVSQSELPVPPPDITPISVLQVNMSPPPISSAPPTPDNDLLAVNQDADINQQQSTDNKITEMLQNKATQSMITVKATAQSISEPPNDMETSTGDTEVQTTDRSSTESRGINSTVVSSTDSSKKVRVRTPDNDLLAVNQDADIDQQQSTGNKITEMLQNKAPPVPVKVFDQVVVAVETAAPPELVEAETAVRAAEALAVSSQQSLEVIGEKRIHLDMSEQVCIGIDPLTHMDTAEIVSCDTSPTEDRLSTESCGINSTVVSSTDSSKKVGNTRKKRVKEKTDEQKTAKLEKKKRQRDRKSVEKEQTTDRTSLDSSDSNSIGDDNLTDSSKKVGNTRKKRAKEKTEKQKTAKLEKKKRQRDRKSAEKEQTTDRTSLDSSDSDSIGDDSLTDSSKKAKNTPRSKKKIQYKKDNKKKSDCLSTGVIYTATGRRYMSATTSNELGNECIIRDTIGKYSTIESLLHIDGDENPKPKQKLMIKKDEDIYIPLTEDYVRNCLNGKYDELFCNKLDGSSRRLLGVHNGHCYLFEMPSDVRTGKIDEDGTVIKSVQSCWKTALGKIYPCRAWPWATVGSNGHPGSGLTTTTEKLGGVILHRNKKRVTGTRKNDKGRKVPIFDRDPKAFCVKIHLFEIPANRYRVLIEYLGDIQSQGGIYASYTGISVKPKRIQIDIIRDQLQEEGVDLVVQHCANLERERVALSAGVICERPINVRSIENAVAVAKVRKGIAKALGKHDVYFNVNQLSMMTNGYILEAGLHNCATQYRVIVMTPGAVKFLEYQGLLGVPVVLGYDTTFCQTKDYWETIITLQCFTIGHCNKPRQNKIFPIARMWHDSCEADCHSHFLNLIASYFPANLTKIIMTKDRELALGRIPAKWQAAGCWRHFDENWKHHIGGTSNSDLVQKTMNELFRIELEEEFDEAYSDALIGPLSGVQNKVFRAYLEHTNQEGEVIGLIPEYKKTTAPWRVRAMLSNPEHPEQMINLDAYQVIAGANGGKVKFSREEWMKDVPIKVSRLLNNAAESCNHMTKVAKRGESTSNAKIVLPEIDESIARCYVLDMITLDCGFQAIWGDGRTIIVKPEYVDKFRTCLANAGELKPQLIFPVYEEIDRSLTLMQSSVLMENDRTPKGMAYMAQVLADCGWSGNFMGACIVKDGHTIGSVHAVTGYQKGPASTTCTCGLNYPGGKFCIHKLTCYKYNKMDAQMPVKYRDGFNTKLLRMKLAKSRAKTGTKQPVRFKYKARHSALASASQPRPMTVIPKYFDFAENGCTITAGNYKRYHETPRNAADGNGGESEDDWISDDSDSNSNDYNVNEQLVDDDIEGESEPDAADDDSDQGVEMLNHSANEPSANDQSPAPSVAPSLALTVASSPARSLSPVPPPAPSQQSDLRPGEAKLQDDRIKKFLALLRNEYPEKMLAGYVIQAVNDLTTLELRNLQATCVIKSKPIVILVHDGNFLIGMFTTTGIEYADFKAVNHATHPLLITGLMRFAIPVYGSAGTQAIVQVTKHVCYLRPLTPGPQMELLIAAMAANYCKGVDLINNNIDLTAGNGTLETILQTKEVTQFMYEPTKINAMKTLNVITARVACTCHRFIIGNGNRSMHMCKAFKYSKNNINCLGLYCTDCVIKKKKGDTWLKWSCPFCSGELIHYCTEIQSDKLASTGGVELFIALMLPYWMANKGPVFRRMPTSDWGGYLRDMLNEAGAGKVAKVLIWWFNFLSQPNIQLVTESADQVLTPKCITEVPGKSMFEALVVDVMAEELTWHRDSVCDICRTSQSHSMLYWEDLPDTDKKSFQNNFMEDEPINIFCDVCNGPLTQKCPSWMPKQDHNLPFMVVTRVVDHLWVDYVVGEAKDFLARKYPVPGFHKENPNELGKWYSLEGIVLEENSNGSSYYNLNTVPIEATATVGNRKMALIMWTGQKKTPVVYMTGCSKSNWTTVANGYNSVAFTSRSWNSTHFLFLLHDHGDAKEKSIADGEQLNETQKDAVVEYEDIDEE